MDSHLILHSETSKIGSYNSTTDGTTLATRNDCSTELVDEEVTGYNGNRITLHSGRMFSVLGESDMGYIDANKNNSYDNGETKTGLIRGFTILSRGSESNYFGAYVAGSYATSTSESGFMVLSGTKLVDAMVLDGNGTNNYTRIWYIVGHVEIGRTWTFEQTYKNGVENWEVKDDVSIPKMGGSSTVFAYNGSSNQPLAPGTLLITTSEEFGEFNKGASGETTIHTLPFPKRSGTRCSSASRCLADWWVAMIPFT